MLSITVWFITVCPLSNATLFQQIFFKMLGVIHVYRKNSLLLVQNQVNGELTKPLALLVQLIEMTHFKDWHFTDVILLRRAATCHEIITTRCPKCPITWTTKNPHLSWTSCQAVYQYTLTSYFRINHNFTDSNINNLKCHLNFTYFFHYSLYYHQYVWHNLHAFPTIFMNIFQFYQSNFCFHF